MNAVNVEQNSVVKLQTRRLVIFLAFAFGIAWATGLVINLTGGLVNSPVIVPSLNLTLALVLLATIYMWAPALANIFTRLITREGFHNLLLWPKLKRGWPYWLAGWFLPAILTILGIVIYFAILPGQFDPNFTTLQTQLNRAAAQTGAAVPVKAQTYFFIVTAQAVFLAPILNLLAVFGEEFGWRAYLQQKLAPLGTRKALLLVGLIWGVWHWPIILMGYEYGFDYWGAPVVGPLLFLFFTVALAIFFGWLVIRGGSVWPSVLAHGAINGIAALGLYAIKGQPNMLLGPAPNGIIGGLPLIALAVFLWLNRKALPEIF